MDEDEDDDDDEFYDAEDVEDVEEIFVRAICAKDQQHDSMYLVGNRCRGYGNARCTHALQCC